MAERELFRSGGVTITDARITSAGRTIPVAHIAGWQFHNTADQVRATEQFIAEAEEQDRLRRQTNRFKWTALLALAGALLAFGLAETADGLLVGWFPVAGGVLALAYLLFSMSSALSRPRIPAGNVPPVDYFLCLQVGGETVSLRFGDSGAAHEAADALGRAIGSSRSGGENRSIADELDGLHRLLEQGRISADEWERAKTMFLGRPEPRRRVSLAQLDTLFRQFQMGAMTEGEYNQKKWDILINS